LHFQKPLVALNTIMPMKLLLLVLLFLPQILFAQLSSSQDRQVDSLKNIIKSASHDSIIVKAWVDWDNIIYISDPTMDLILNERIDSLCSIQLKKNLNQKEKRFFLKFKAFAQTSFGLMNQNNGEYEKAIKNHLFSLSIKKELGDRKGMAAPYNNLGNIYKYQGDYVKAIDCYSKSLKIREEFKDDNGIATSFNNIGVLYKDQKDYKKAISTFQKSLKLYRKMKDKIGEAAALNNLGSTYQDYKENEKALDYYNKSLKIREEIGDQYGVATSLYNIGNIHLNKNETDKALEFYQRSLTIRELIDDKRGIAISLLSMADIYREQGKTKEALLFSTRAFSIAISMGAALEQRDAAEILWKVHDKLGNYKTALEMHQLYILKRDSLESEENQKEIIRQQYSYEYEKQAEKDSVITAEEKKVKDAQIAQQKTEIKAKKTQQYMLFGGLALVFIFSIFIYNRFRVTQKQNIIIEEQKHIVEEKNKEITDSINYAKRIQTAILPPDKMVKEILPDAFILYKPKDIVAGDFYWMEDISTSHNDKTILLAACDCTGHGVPGAMVSVVCNNGLNRAVREYGMKIPGEIMDKTRELVIQEFEKSEEEVKDGMDMSLLSITIKENGEKNGILKWAGANNPLWIIRPSSSSGATELIEFKPNKQPIGKYTDPKPFTTHEIEVKKGDSIYIFTDGYVDQFGGEKGKKFKSSNFRELLLSIQDKSMSAQREILNDKFESWKSNIEQNDDVSVIGIKI
jgi:tetratricopeptide (TPR) repeat protein